MYKNSIIPYRPAWGAGQKQALAQKTGGINPAFVQVDKNPS